MHIAAILRQKGGEIAQLGAEASIAEVVALLTARRIGAVLVLDAARQIRGIVSERDVVQALARSGGQALHMTAGQVMTADVRTATPRTTVVEAMQIMTEGRFRHLPVLEDGQLVGIVSIGDIVKARISATEQEVDSLRAYVAGAA